MKAKLVITVDIDPAIDLNAQPIAAIRRTVVTLEYDRLQR